MEKKIAWLTLEREFLIEGNFGEEVCNFEEGSVVAENSFQRGNFLDSVEMFGCTQQVEDRTTILKLKYIYLGSYYC